MIRVPLKDAINQIKDEKVVMDWLDGLTEKSERNYLKALADFTIVTGLTPNQLLNIAFREKEDRIPSWESQVKEWFKAYNQHNSTLKRSKATRNSRRNIIKGFFHYHDLDTPKEQNKRKKADKLKIKNKRPALTKNKIKKALDAARTLRIKAIMLVQASSGLSEADVVKLKIQDFYDGLIKITDDGLEICRLHLNREKTGKEFTTFFSYEAVDAVKNYIWNERRFEDDPYLFQKHHMSKSDLGPQINEDLIEGEYRALNRWMNNEKKEDGLYNDITSHMLRKFFNTQLTNSKMSYEPRKHMMGHVIPGVDDSYYLEHQDELIELYIEYMHKITITPTKTVTIESEEYRKIKNELEASKKLEREREERDKQQYEENKELKDLVIQTRQDIKTIAENPEAWEVFRRKVQKEY